MKIKQQYVYQITNNINQRYYVGKGSSKCLPKYDMGYMGSSDILDAAMNKHGKENFTKIILSEWSTEMEAYQEEARIVNKEFITWPETYNIALGGNGDYKDRKENGVNVGYIRTEEHKEKIRQSNKRRTGSIWIHTIDNLARKRVSTIEEANRLINTGDWIIGMGVATEKTSDTSVKNKYNLYKESLHVEENSKTSWLKLINKQGEALVNVATSVNLLATGKWELGRLHGINYNRKKETKLFFPETNEKASTNNQERITELLESGWHLGTGFTKTWMHNYDLGEQRHVVYFKDYLELTSEGWNKRMGSALSRNMYHLETGKKKHVTLIHKQEELLRHGWDFLKNRKREKHLWITNITDNKAILVRESKIPEYLNNNYTLGRTINE